MSELNSILPQVDGCKPIWNGQNFQIGDNTLQVLKFSTNLSGWDDELTFMHENAAGDCHPIDIASRYLALTELQGNLNKNCKKPILLEIGCSSGYFLKDLKDKFGNAEVVGADVVSQPLFNLAQQLPNTPLLQFDLLECPLPDNCLDAVIMLNVLEHIEDDFKALKQVFRILKPNGVLILEVPAGPELYDIYDEQLKHFRRYSSDELQKKIMSVGFKVEKSSHLGFFLYPFFKWVKRKNQKLTNNSGQLDSQIVKDNIKRTQGNVFLKYLLKLECFLDKYINYPVGIRCTVTCKK